MIDHCISCSVNSHCRRSVSRKKAPRARAFPIYNKNYPADPAGHARTNRRNPNPNPEQLLPPSGSASDRREEEDELLRPAAPRRRPAAARLPREGRLPAAGLPAGRLPTSGAGLPAAGVPPAGLPAAVCAAATPAAAEQRAFLHGGMPGRPLLLLPLGRMLLRGRRRRAFSETTSWNGRIATELVAA